MAVRTRSHTRQYRETREAPPTSVRRWLTKLDGEARAVERERRDAEDLALLAGHVAAALRARLDRLDPPRRPPPPPPRPVGTGPARRHVQVVRLPDGGATTLTDGKVVAVECPGCGDLALTAGYGVCLSCRCARRRFEVVS